MNPRLQGLAKSISDFHESPVKGPSKATGAFKHPSNDGEVPDANLHHTPMDEEAVEGMHQKIGELVGPSTHAAIKGIMAEHGAPVPKEDDGEDDEANPVATKAPGDGKGASPRTNGKSGSGFSLTAFK